MMKVSKILSICVAVMGLVHIVATFTPLIANKLSMLEESAQGAFVYFSLMCGALLLVGGLVCFMIADKVSEYQFLRKPYSLLLSSIAIDGILAVCYMPHNPFAWTVFVLAVALTVAGFVNNKK